MRQADVYSITGPPYLSIATTTFTIAHLDNKMVTAVNTLDLMCVRQSLVIDRQAQTISLVRTKINKEQLCAPVQDAPLTIYLGNPKFVSRTSDAVRSLAFKRQALGDTSEWPLSQSGSPTDFRTAASVSTTFAGHRATTHADLAVVESLCSSDRLHHDLRDFSHSENVLNVDDTEVFASFTPARFCCNASSWILNSLSSLKCSTDRFDTPPGHLKRLPVRA